MLKTRIQEHQRALMLEDLVSYFSYASLMMTTDEFNHVADK